MPERIRLSRQKGYRKPAGAVVVSRPSKWGNPFRVEGTTTRARAVALFEHHAVGVYPWTAQRIRDELGGKDLACWCPLDQPCHADVLLRLANFPAIGATVTRETSAGDGHRQPVLWEGTVTKHLRTKARVHWTLRNGQRTSAVLDHYPHEIQEQRHADPSE